MLHFGKLTTFGFVSLAIVLSILFAVVQFLARAPSPPGDLALQQDGRLHVFFLPDCPHCHDAIEFLKTQRKIDFVLHDASTRANQATLSIVAKQHGISAEDLGVPFFVFGSHYLMGFESAETTGRELLALVAEQTPITQPDATSNATDSR
jgi:glutaredoxin